MNTSKSLNDVLTDLIATVIVASASESPVSTSMKAEKKAHAAIVEAVLDMIGEDLTYGTESGAVKAVDNEKRRLRKAIEEWQ